MDITNLLFGFQGRINRQLWWLTSIGITIVMGAIIAGLAIGLGTTAPTPDNLANHQTPSFAWVIINILSFAHLWMGFALNAKRWHDRGKSGWWTLVFLVPVIGEVWILVECGFLRGTQGVNQYGPDPLSRD